MKGCVYLKMLFGISKKLKYRLSVLPFIIRLTNFTGSQNNLQSESHFSIINPHHAMITPEFLSNELSNNPHARGRHNDE
jgi:hypothetical protein